MSSIYLKPEEVLARLQSQEAKDAFNRLSPLAPCWETSDDECKGQVYLSSNIDTMVINADTRQWLAGKFAKTFDEAVITQLSEIEKMAAPDNTIVVVDAIGERREYTYDPEKLIFAPHSPK